MSLTVAVLRETAEGEKRVALDPGSASKLEKRGIRVLVEKDAGKQAGFNN